MNSKQAVLWDMDGVLVDTGELHYQTWVDALARYEIGFPREQFAATFGMNNRGTLTTLLGKPPDPAFLAEVSDIKEKRFREEIRGNAHPLPGVLAWLEELRKLGMRQAVASSAPQENVDVLIDELGIRGYMDAIVAAADLPWKPDPAVFLKAARLVNVPPEGCVVIEDAIPGVEAAKRAGMKCIAVLTSNPPEALQKADVITPTLEQLPVETVLKLLCVDKP